MPITIDIEDSEVLKKVFMEGYQEGLIKGKRIAKLRQEIEAMLESKYGSTGLKLMDIVRAIDDIDTLDEFIESIKKYSSATEFIAYLQTKTEIMKMPLQDDDILKHVLIEGELKGKLEAIEVMLEIKYGAEGLELMDMVRNIKRR
ncbi:hypothetical protein MBAV_001776 [Candidatus Magnetobacterium bavaricum]|uniref:DUF4351 domain-containing protein n=1 Tax=Candidatus Magnetobacterium bavaricum TaxID=29290 RepID=A0A0F3GVZ3_9BACT|nr:hypothetical protein MBAV_001776 [Candidatus Magnetobacterium bavaricum]